ncbi:Neuropeptide-Like Protein [Caenorhabditis elegans]|uniref:Neuropeptide-Like Protein n=1 Tax=Caenorhabditis elegans TaxID=6239 RepID=Q22737_CAEEL|nr:Neuropeptide-Like Protein [Caenorhabditis elegans]CCD71460.1 Neuropeptide-Like Protein [Caenorhabditis elegans]|eukprot:NP_508424.1 Neuropeptide-Like Protein [Caenorhabditis elegans]
MRSIIVFIGLTIFALDILLVQTSALGLQGGIDVFRGLGVVDQVDFNQILHRANYLRNTREGRLRYWRLRTLPIMKKSIAIGRAGFRPGKRTTDELTGFPIGV